MGVCNRFFGCQWGMAVILGAFLAFGGAASVEADESIVNNNAGLSMVPLEFMPQLTELHHFQNSVAWRLSPDGLEVEGATQLLDEKDAMTLTKIWNDYGNLITEWSNFYQVPAELILATIGVESRGNPRAVNRIHSGLMQMAPATAKFVLHDKKLKRQDLFKPEVAIRAGAAYIAYQAALTGFDPPKVAAAYNAGSLIRCSKGRWNLKQATGHLNRYVQWFNTAAKLLRALDCKPPTSFARYFTNPFFYGVNVCDTTLDLAAPGDALALKMKSAEEAVRE